MTGMDTELFPPELVHLLATARVTIDAHTNEHGICAVCRTAWPCERAALMLDAL